VDAFFVHETQGRCKGFVNSGALGRRGGRIRRGRRHAREKGKLYSKRMVTVVVMDDMVEDVVQAIAAVNRTGKPGDGKIFVLPMADTVRVHTGEKGAKSIA
jgi:nitrogen regulatory protein PII 2